MTKTENRGLEELACKTLKLKTMHLKTLGDRYNARKMFFKGEKR